MLKQLRADLYKLFRSRVMWICYAVCVALFVFFTSSYYTPPTPYDTFTIVDRVDCVITAMLIHQDIVTYAIVLSACLFLSKDYDTKFFKNISDKSLTSRLYQVLSKMVCMLILVISIYLLWLGINVANAAARYYGKYGMGFFYGVENMFDKNRNPLLEIKYTVVEWIKSDALYLLLAFAATTIIMAMASVFRNTYATTLTALCWSVASQFLFLVLDPLFKLEDITLRHFTVFGGMIGTIDAINFAKMEWDLHVADKMIAVSIIAIAICSIISWLVSYHREER